jgi:hypothetical protein
MRVMSVFSDVLSEEHHVDDVLPGIDPRLLRHRQDHVEDVAARSDANGIGVVQVRDVAVVHRRELDGGRVGKNAGEDERLAAGHAVDCVRRKGRERAWKQTRVRVQHRDRGRQDVRRRIQSQITRGAGIKQNRARLVRRVRGCGEIEGTRHGGDLQRAGINGRLRFIGCRTFRGHDVGAEIVDRDRAVGRDRDTGDRRVKSVRIEIVLDLVGALPHAQRRDALQFHRAERGQVGESVAHAQPHAVHHRNDRARVGEGLIRPVAFDIAPDGNIRDA